MNRATLIFSLTVLLCGTGDLEEMRAVGSKIRTGADWSMENMHMKQRTPLTMQKNESVPDDGYCG